MDLSSLQLFTRGRLMSPTRLITQHEHRVCLAYHKHETSTQFWFSIGLAGPVVDGGPHWGDLACAWLTLIASIHLFTFIWERSE